MFPMVNYALVTLIPKKNEANIVKEMRPIACCSIIYKIISKILTVRLSKVINVAVEDNQLAFLPGKLSTIISSWRMN